MKKIISVAAAMLMLVTLCACNGNDEPVSESNTASATSDAASVGTLTNENVKEKMAILMPQAEKIYGYLMLGLLDVGEFDYDEAVVDSENGCKYTPVVDENLNTIAKVKAYCETYFTKEYCESELYGSFEGTYELYKEFDGVLCLNVDAGGGGADTYITETAQITLQTSDTVVVSMDCRDSYDGQYIAMVTLKLVDGTYKINSINTSEG